MTISCTEINNANMLHRHRRMGHTCPTYCNGGCQDSQQILVNITRNFLIKMPDVTAKMTQIPLNGAHSAPPGL